VPFCSNVDGKGAVFDDSCEVVQDRGGGDEVGATDIIFDAERMPGPGVVAEGVPWV